MPSTAMLRSSNNGARRLEKFDANGLLRKLTEDGCLDDAFQAVVLMNQQGTRVPQDIFYRLLQLCIDKKDFTTGRKVHSFILHSGFKLNAFIGSHLIRMYAACGNLFEANQVFNTLPEQTVFTWSAIILAHSNLGKAQQAVDLYCHMQQSSIKPDEYVSVAVLKACASTTALTEGKLVHVHVMEHGFDLDHFVGSTLIDMYAKCGSVEDAQSVFNKLANRDSVTWNAVISAFAQYGMFENAFQLFEKMQYEGWKPDSVTFISLLKSCSSLAALDYGKIIHSMIMESSVDLDNCVGNTLISMYAKCGSLEDAHSVFKSLPTRNIVSWSAMIAGFAQCGYGCEALNLFRTMQGEGLVPNSLTLIGILKACSNITSLNLGKLVHAHIIGSYIRLDVVLGNILIDVYSKCGSVDDARCVFDKILEREVVTWNAMIAGYAKCRSFEVALQLFNQMQQEGTKPNGFTFASVLQACSNIAAIDQGKLVHTHILESDIQWNEYVGSSLIDMYAKGGSLKEAARVFDALPKQSVLLWSAMIEGCAFHSDYKSAIRFFQHMLQQGLRPDHVTFVSLLSACSRAGLIDEAHLFFKSIKENYSTAPVLEHYTCMLDLLGRAGLLNDAEDILQSMPVRPDEVSWMSLLNNCRTYGNMDLGRHCFDHAVTMDHKFASGYSLMENIYMDANMWEEADTVHSLRKSADAWKKPGMAFIEVGNVVHEFIVADKGHSHFVNIYAKINRLGLQSREEGYVPHLDYVPKSMSNKDNECLI